MKPEKPCSPSHCLGMLNDNMRTDILRNVHEYLLDRKAQNDQRSPLELLLESINHTLGRFKHSRSFEQVERNPFNVDENVRQFNLQLDAQHDMKLLRSQRAGLQALYDSISSDYFAERAKT